MKHAGAQTIYTPRLTLRPFQPGDAEAMYKNWTSDPEVAKYTTWSAHPNVYATEGFLQYLLSKQDRIDNYAWGIVYDGQLIGSIDVVRASDETRSCEIGYCMSRAYWRRGIMSEALNAVVRYLFLNTGYEQITAKHHKDNPGSGGVMRKAGMKFLYEDEEMVEKFGSLQPMCHYALERADWERDRA